MTNQPDYLEGEVEILDALIDLYPDPAPDWSDDEWELRMYRAVPGAWAFYGGLKGGQCADDFAAFDRIVDEWAAGKLTRVYMQQAFGRSDRYLKRYYERFPERKGGC